MLKPLSGREDVSRFPVAASAADGEVAAAWTAASAKLFMVTSWRACTVGAEGAQNVDCGAGYMNVALV